MTALVGTITALTLNHCKMQQDDEALLARLIQEKIVRVRLLDDPGGLNPYNSLGASSEYVYTLMYESLLGRDLRTLQLVPVVAKDLPQIVDTFLEPYGKAILFFYEIRQEATWPDGKPITGYDIAFSLKLIKNPHTNCPRLRPYLEFFVDVIIDSTNPKKLIIVADTPYMNLLDWSGGIEIVPEHIYDPQHKLRKYTVWDFASRLEQFRDDPDLREIAERWNQVNFKPQDFFTSGPYVLKEYAVDQRIVLERNRNWWADRLPNAEKNMFHYAYPQRIEFIVINDATTAIASLTRNRIDLLSFNMPEDFIKMKRDPDVSKNYHFIDTLELAYTYIGLNMRHPILRDRRVREALAHLIDKKKIVEKILLGYAQPVTGPIHPALKKFYNDTLKDYEYNPEKARQLLEAAGWKDLNNDGILDKHINNQMTPLRLEILYNSGNETRKRIALMFKEEARRLGIDIHIVEVDWSIYLERLRRREFDMNIGGWIGSPLPSDPRQIWHTAAYHEGGDNFVGFGNDTTDRIIEELRTSISEDRQAELWRLLQVYIHRDIPYIFLYAPRNLFVVHRRFQPLVSIARPGYYLPAFQLNQQAIAAQ